MIQNQNTFCIRAFTLLVTFLVSSVLNAQVFKCEEDGETFYNNSPASAKLKNCVKVKAPKPVVIELPGEDFSKRPARVGLDYLRIAPPSSLPGATPSSVSTVSFPRVDAATQKFRDNDRAAILDEERRKETMLLSELKREFNNGTPERRFEDKDQAKYQERVERLRQSILRAETNVRSLERELQSVR